MINWFRQDAKTVQREKIVFSTNGTGTTGYQHANELAHIIWKESNSKWIIYLTVGDKSINI